MSRTQFSPKFSTSTRRARSVDLTPEQQKAIADGAGKVIGAIGEQIGGAKPPPPSTPPKKETSPWLIAAGVVLLAVLVKRYA